MEHWFFDNNNQQRDPAWRRTTLVGYGHFKSETPMPKKHDTIYTGKNMTITSGCNSGRKPVVGIGADAGLGDSKTMSVVFAGPWVGGFLTGWDRDNRYGAQEEKFGTIVPEFMLATEPKRHMGAGLLSNGHKKPWKPMAGWYILGAGTYVHGSYPFWTPKKVHISDRHDYIAVGTGRRMRRRGLVGILAKPCNDRPGCKKNNNTADVQYRCYNQQVDDRDLYPEHEGGANLWGIAGGAYDFANWPAKSRGIMESDEANKNWVLQAGGWGAGAFGCGSLYGGLIQALAAKKGGWEHMRMCWASGHEAFPTIESKMSFASGNRNQLRHSAYVWGLEDSYEPLMDAHHISDFTHGKMIFSDDKYGMVADQLYNRIEQYVPPQTCQSTKCNKIFNVESDCMASMKWCCDHPEECEWHKNKHEDIRDFVSKSCHKDCAHICINSEDVPPKCRKPQAAERSCRTQGCGGEFNPKFQCQCAPECSKHDNCCADFVDFCGGIGAGEIEKESCAAYGCDEAFHPERKCQCGPSCKNHRNCCKDYKETCGVPRPRHFPNEPAAAEASCLHYGCSKDYVKNQKCQCSGSCNKFGNCCSDYEAVCAAPKPPAHSCAAYGCGGSYVKSRQCQCTTDCAKYNSCCSDYKEHCTGENAPKPVSPHYCIAAEGQKCQGGMSRLGKHKACEPECAEGQVALGPWVCPRGGESEFAGPGCVATAELPQVPYSEVDSVENARHSSDMVFKEFTLVNGTQNCEVWPELPEQVQQFIREQAGKYGPSAHAIYYAKQEQPMEFFLNIEQVSILLAQLLCGATEDPLYTGLKKAIKDEHLKGSGSNPQTFAYGRAMEHWFFDNNNQQRDPAWRRTTLVGYGHFKSETPMPKKHDTIYTGKNMTITSGCNSGRKPVVGIGADAGLGDSKTMSVVFAGPWVGGFLTGWDRDNRYGAQEEKFGTIVPEFMLATEPKRHMGAGLLSNGHKKPWKPMAGWYILGAGTYVHGSYPFWTPKKVHISDRHDYIAVGTGRRMRRRGLVGILAKPCNDRPGCKKNNNTADVQYRCYNQQVDDRDLYPEHEGGANLWGIAGGAYDFANWPAKSRGIMESDEANKNWVLQAGGWGAGAFGCGSLYGGLIQALAAKKGGWEHMRMCWASGHEAFPTIESKMSFASGNRNQLRHSAYVWGLEDSYEPLMDAHHISDFTHGKMIFSDDKYGMVADQLYNRIEQYVPPQTCQSTKCNKIFNVESDCMASMKWCCDHPEECEWHKNKHEDIRDFVSKSCHKDCAHICINSEDVPPKCRKPQAAERSCRTQGCGGEFNPKFQCQCAPECSKHDNCCADFVDFCGGIGAGEIEKESCAAYGCDEAFHPERKCQCGPSCKNHRNCCKDYKETCGVPRPRHFPNEPAAAEASCLHYGCSKDYVKNQKCQCSGSCNKFGNCCSDYEAVCAAPKPPAHSCAAYGCGGSYVKSRQCQCTTDCAKYNSCCSDYKEKCEHHEPPKPPRNSCANFGCGGAYVKTQQCQCTANCAKYNSCCSDYQAVCEKKRTDSCAHYGCGKDFVPGQSCQCSEGCKKHGNCCDDYDAKCGAPPSPVNNAPVVKPDSCAVFGCGGEYDHSRKCQCSPTCKQHNNCCSDFDDLCLKQSCKAVGCNRPYSATLPCQCSNSCEKYNNCCWDFKTVCK
eukprot:TRINITY_DN2265_c0_g1_i1.p1 TRINITY_DN2265_c0_g1~~TRINITY_DN2265_c0_g1_i1.p1  ORF type:complete len:1859 (-),score=400.83 TRINITY_DN2265_c0_g1_i1:290-5251(-)